jgi:hypothetical protein
VSPCYCLFGEGARCSSTLSDETTVHRRTSDAIKCCSSARTVLLCSLRRSVRNWTVTSHAISAEGIRNASRMSRLPRLRSTARDAALRPAIIPTRVWPAPFAHARMTKLRLATRSPDRNTASNSLPLRSTPGRVTTVDLLKQPGVRAPWLDAHLVRRVRPWFSCVRESHACAYGAFWTVGMYASC